MHGSLGRVECPGGVLPGVGHHLAFQLDAGLHGELQVLDFQLGLLDRHVTRERAASLTVLLPNFCHPACQRTARQGEPTRSKLFVRLLCRLLGNHVLTGTTPIPDRLLDRGRQARTSQQHRRQPAGHTLQQVGVVIVLAPD